jgi:ANTAR domain
MAPTDDLVERRNVLDRAAKELARRESAVHVLETSARKHAAVALERDRIADQRDELAARATDVAETELENLRAALTMRMLMGQAVGILMERHGLDSGRALTMLVGLSRETGVKIQVVAGQLVAATAAEFPASIPPGLG